MNIKKYLTEQHLLHAAMNFIKIIYINLKLYQKLKSLKAIM